MKSVFEHSLQTIFSPRGSKKDVPPTPVHFRDVFAPPPLTCRNQNNLNTDPSLPHLGEEILRRQRGPNCANA